MTAPSAPWVVGIDVGGTGSRARAVHLETGEVRERRSTGTSATSSGAPRAVVEAADAAASALQDTGKVAAVVVGASGFSTMAVGLDSTRARVGEVLGCHVIGFAPDIFTAHVGALSDATGAVLAVGTGSIAMSRSRTGTWSTVDGWGHLLGDLGSASWIGRQGLVEALRQLDRRTTDAAAMLAAAVDRFGDPLTWPRQFAERTDRAGVFATFAPEVLRCATKGDVAAIRLRDRAVDHLTDTAAAALAQPEVPPVLALTGGVFDDADFRGALAEAVVARTGAQIVPALGSPLDGAIAIARRAAAGEQPTIDGLLEWE
ncbi:BadF/BadG/BcrA/BcrD ATPase family protein [Diaminobutyricimonas sp. TR449]|uniref:N-acetylglucosamine kinase n=1 Tax=Diaminobutyricimonas sp. TR449 TaxID=2708076 RepID=UPI00141EE7C4|nr:BadF/BadG/BcrA/BcrD ATPase family protein [Diaminobutyricimonas sp. TR449]